MHYYELIDTPRRIRPKAQTCTVRLIVSRLQLNELQTVLGRHDGVEIVGSTHIGFGVSIAEIRCNDARTAEKLTEAWFAHLEQSPICFRL
jgi:hypothetical protein